ncbi:4315_t:CDS:1, partial [Funneliformis geosporum]
PILEERYSRYSNLSTPTYISYAIIDLICISLSKLFMNSDHTYMDNYIQFLDRN